MSTTSPRRLRGWASLLSLLGLCLDLATCQTATYKLTSTPTNFQGFYVANPTSVSRVDCPTTETWSTSSTYGNCCVPGQECPFYSNCAGGRLTRVNGDIWTCPASTLNCFTMTVLPKSPYLAATASWLVMGCGPSWSANTIFREIVPTVASVTASVTLTADPTTITAELSSEPSSSAPQSSNPGASPGSPQQTDTTPPAAGATETASPSKAWIAGAVIGPLVAVAAVVFLFFWLGKRHGAKDTGVGAASPPGYAPPEQQQQYGQPMYSPTPPGHPMYDPPPFKQEMPVQYQGPGGYPQQWYAYPPQVHELTPAEMLPQELGSGERLPQELPGAPRR
ncbi:hypothetical protein QBC39DRAFT_331591 [Podospora conica]|nr:hypothetical protein QBC39DRAFT_331591 [Schizothecium conicum]